MLSRKFCHCEFWTHKQSICLWFRCHPLSSSHFLHSTIPTRSLPPHSSCYLFVCASFISNENCFACAYWLVCRLLFNVKCVCVRWIRNYILYIIYIDRLIRGSRKYVLYFIKFIFFSQVLINFFLHHKANFTHKSCPQTYFLLCLINLIHINGKSALKDSRKNTAYMNTMDVYWHSVSTKNSRKHVTMKMEIKCEKVTKNQIDPILWHCHRVHCTQANENYAVTVGASRRVSKWERERLKRKPFSSLIPIIWKFHCTNFIGRMVIRECVLFNIQNIYHIE